MLCGSGTKSGAPMPLGRMLTAASALISAGLVFGQSAQPVPQLTLTYASLPETGDSLFLIARVELAPGWSINSNQPLDSFLIPTRLEASSPGVVFGAPRYPEPVLENSVAVGGNLSLFHGRFEIRVPARFKPRTGPKAGGSSRAAAGSGPWT